MFNVPKAVTEEAESLMEKAANNYPAHNGTRIHYHILADEICSKSGLPVEKGL